MSPWKDEVNKKLMFQVKTPIIYVRLKTFQIKLVELKKFQFAEM